MLTHEEKCENYFIIDIPIEVEEDSDLYYEINELCDSTFQIEYRAHVKTDWLNNQKIKVSGEIIGSDYDEDRIDKYDLDQIEYNFEKDLNEILKKHNITI